MVYWNHLVRPSVILCVKILLQSSRLRLDGLNLLFKFCIRLHIDAAPSCEPVLVAIRYQLLFCETFPFFTIWNNRNSVCHKNLDSPNGRNDFKFGTCIWLYIDVVYVLSEFLCSLISTTCIHVNGCIPLSYSSLIFGVDGHDNISLLEMVDTDGRLIFADDSSFQIAYIRNKIFLSLCPCSAF